MTTTSTPTAAAGAKSAEPEMVMVKITVPQQDGEIRINPFDDRPPRRWDVVDGVISVEPADVNLALTHIDGARPAK